MSLLAILPGIPLLGPRVDAVTCTYHVDDDNGIRGILASHVPMPKGITQ